MPSYIPEHYYSFTGCDEQRHPTYGLVPWPEHLKPREVDLTKKGEAYVQAALTEAGGVFFLTLDSRDRTSIATTIERLINLLDEMDGDPDLEPYLAGQHMNDRMIDLEGGGGYGGDCDQEPSLGWQNDGAQVLLDCDLYDEAEVENEHGGDILDQPHDAIDEGNDEPFLGWSEYQSSHGAPSTGYEFPRDGGGYAMFDGDGAVAARKVLRNLQQARPDIHQDYVGGFCGGNYDALRVEGLTVRSNRAVLGGDGALTGRATSDSRAKPRDEGMIPHLDLRAHYRAVQGQRS